MAKETPGLSNQQTQTESPLLQILNFLSSMQLGIILLLALAVISVFATLREYETAIQTVYKSWWFIGIMSFSALNLLLCSVRRVGPLSRQALQPKKVQSADTIRNMPVYDAVKLSEVSPETAVTVASNAFSAAGLKVDIEDGPEGKVVFGERGKFGYFGSVVTHFGLLIILLGAMYGALTGFEESNGGISGDHFLVPKGNFTVNISDVRMEQEKDPTIRPRVYSDVVVTKAGEEVASGTVAINQPLRFDGNTIYHTTFRYVSDVEIKDLETGRVIEQQLYDQQQLFLEHNGAFIHFLAFFPNFTMNKEGMPYSINYLPEKVVFAGVMYDENQTPLRNVFLRLNMPEVVETPNGKYELTLTGYQNAAVYSITRNLGRPFLFGGAVLLVVGLYMSFFLFPRRFWAVYDEKKSTLLIGGRSYRNRLGVEQDLEKISSEITKREGE